MSWLWPGEWRRPHDRAGCLRAAAGGWCARPQNHSHTVHAKCMLSVCISDDHLDREAPRAGYKHLLETLHQCVHEHACTACVHRVCRRTIDARTDHGAPMGLFWGYFGASLITGTCTWLTLGLALPLPRARECQLWLGRGSALPLAR